MKIIADMPDKWSGQRCGLCCECPLLYWVRKATGNNRTECPLANAKKAVYSGYADSLGAHMIATPKGKAVTLWATELEEKK